MSKTTSKQVGGTHYQKDIQPWEVIDACNLNYYAGNIVKYVMRYQDKNGKQDLEKAKHYIEHLIDNYERLHKNESKLEGSEVVPVKTIAPSINVARGYSDPNFYWFSGKP